MATVTAVNAMATIQNLNLIGVFDTNPAIGGLASATAIPINTIGLYQLMDKMTSDLFFIKKTLAANQIVLQSDLVGDLDGTLTVTDPVFISTREAADTIFNDRGGLTVAGLTNTKPSLLDDGTNRFSEDALFQFFSQIDYELLKFRYNLATGNNNGAGAGHPGEFAIPISAKATGD